ncbi:hypothetical protein N657DRAFT_37644 [Parathielavia appendiculata]|uniref:Secreted protein n=1 Tax=Parathielavia appendiculata TaxID=2587402 RepID=A0AAN6UA50_9PEZI|nr:hypothetical protein N657DRAFT_37644 [Parathielavia appendiculata]
MQWLNLTGPHASRLVLSLAVLRPCCPFLISNFASTTGDFACPRLLSPTSCDYTTSQTLFNHTLLATDHHHVDISPPTTSTQGESRLLSPHLLAIAPVAHHFSSAVVIADSIEPCPRLLKPLSPSFPSPHDAGSSYLADRCQLSTNLVHHRVPTPVQLRIHPTPRAESEAMKSAARTSTST